MGISRIQFFRITLSFPARAFHFERGTGNASNRCKAVFSAKNMKIRYLRFKPHTALIDGRPIFSVLTKQSGILLGEIRYVLSWRRFAFDPFSRGAILDWDRAFEISEFLKFVETNDKPGRELTDADIF